MKALIHKRTELAVESVLLARRGSYIFHGPAGAGKAVVALDLARRLNCQGDEPETCAACIRFEAGAYPDLITLRPEDKPSIVIEQIRVLGHALSLGLYSASGVRVVVIDDAHLMTPDAQNALLKMLEEPPPGTLFILVAERLEALLPTIRSRCAQIFFPRLDTALVAGMLERDHKLKPAEAARVSVASGGMPGEAVRLANQPAQAQALIELSELAAGTLTSSLFQRLVTVRRLVESKADIAKFGRLLHSNLIFGIRDGQTDEAEGAKKLVALEFFRRQMSAKVSPRVALERLMLEL